MDRALDVNLAAVIQCNRCERACRDLQVNDVIGMAYRGAHTQVVFDLADPMGGSSCVGCGECVQACPTGALMPKTHIGPQSVDREVDSVCPFCGVGEPSAAWGAGRACRWRYGDRLGTHIQRVADHAASEGSD